MSTLNRVENNVIDETVKEVWKYYNLDIFSNVIAPETNTSLTPILSFEDIPELESLKETVVHNLKEKRRRYDALTSNSRSFSISHNNLEKQRNKYSRPLSDDIAIAKVKNSLLVSNEYGYLTTRIFESDVEIDTICTVKWCLCRQIKIEIDAYIEMVTNSDTFHHRYLGDMEMDADVFNVVYAWHDVDLTEFWKSNTNNFPFLSTLAKKITIGTSSSAAIERVFSVATNYYSHRRANLQPEYVESMMLLKMNRQNDHPIDTLTPSD